MDASVLDYEPCNIAGPINRDDIHPDSTEFWLVRAGPQVDLSELVGRKLPCVDGASYRTSMYSLSASQFVPDGVHLLLPNSKGRKLKSVGLPISGQIQATLRTSTIDGGDEPVTSPITTDVTRPGIPAMPDVDVKRHPLLGVDYESALKDRKRALELPIPHLEATSSTSRKPKKKKHKTK